jgi:hypothetical protein
VLINSILSSLPMFMLSFFRFRKVYFKRLTILDRDFFSQNDSQKEKYMLTKLSMVCQPKDRGLEILTWKSKISAC